MWTKISSVQDLHWLAVLIVGIFTTVFGQVVTNAVTVRRSHNTVRLWSEVLAGNQLTYLAFFFALMTALDLQEMYKNLCLIVILLSVLFFIVGLLNNRTYERLVVRAGHSHRDESCAEELNADTRKRILGWNPSLAIVSLALTLALIFALQYGLEPPPAQTHETLEKK